MESILNNEELNNYFEDYENFENTESINSFISFLDSNSTDSFEEDNIYYLKNKNSENNNIIKDKKDNENIIEKNKNVKIKKDKQKIKNFKSQIKLFHDIKWEKQRVCDYIHSSERKQRKMKKLIDKRIEKKNNNLLYINNKKINNFDFALDSKKRINQNLSVDKIKFEKIIQMFLGKKRIKF